MTLFDQTPLRGQRRLRVAIYARVSTDLQDNSNQLQALEGWVKNRGWTLVRTYTESETAWKDGHQKELGALVQDAYKRKFDLVAVWALDRISRQGPLQILQFVHKLRNSGVLVYSMQEPWTEAPGELGDLLLSITGWVARYESQRRSERTKAGMKRAAASGVHVGRPRKKSKLPLMP